MTADPEIDEFATEAKDAFSRALGVSAVTSRAETVGNRWFLTFEVGRRAPIYDRALREAQKHIGEGNAFRGKLRLEVRAVDKFPESLEADVLLGLLAATRTVASTVPQDRRVPFVPFQNQEDQKVIQPANQLIVGRRGVGKSTLITRAVELLAPTNTACAVLDMQAYTQRADSALFADVFSDLAREIRRAIISKDVPKTSESVGDLETFANNILERPKSPSMSADLRRIVAKATRRVEAVVVFLDDFHLIDSVVQPRLAQAILGALKGANGWLKVAGVRSLLNYYDPKTRTGLQVPGDAQLVPLDLTLVDPKAAERHIRLILSTFLKFVGVESLSTVIAEAAFRRLVWANAGVPRDFLQMFSRSLEHARRSSRAKVVLSDTNLAIGEFGQQKMSELEQDARNSEDLLRGVLEKIEHFCLDEKKVNAFLIRQNRSDDLRYVQTLSDLRLVHLLHQTITPHKAGERYEAYVLDYSLFTGFRRRPNVREMLPADGEQFKAAELRKIPILPAGVATPAGSE